MRIAILLPDLGGGGAERVIVNLANALVMRGYSVDLVLLKATGVLLDAIDKEVSIVDLKVRGVRRLLWPLHRYLKNARPDVLIANMWPLTMISVVAKWWADRYIRLIVVEHTTWSRSEQLTRPTVGWQVRTSMHYFFPKADAIVTVSRGAADDLACFAKLDRSRINVIYNPVAGLDKPTFNTVLNPEEWWVGSHKRVLAVGTLKTIKDYTTLLKAFACLSSQMNVRLLILGEGQCRSSLESLMVELGLVGKVFMPGFIKDTWPYYQKADLHVLSSTGEGFGNVIVEALAAGTPVVSTDCPSGPREILADGQFGRLVPVGDAEALANAMAESLSSTHDRAGLKARAQDFSIDKAVDQYEALLFPGHAIGK